MFTINRIKFLNYFISLIPLSLILGNLAVNINVTIICILGLMLFGKEIFFINEKKYQYLIYLFFVYLIFITLFNNISNFEKIFQYKKNFYKSIFFLRFLIMFLIINYLIQKDQLNIKLFYISCAFFSVVISFDVLIQVITGKNLTGYEITNFKPSSFFGSENIAGSYLQKFIPFFIFFFVSSNKILKKNLCIFILLMIFTIPIILTSNRMPTLIYMSSLILFFLMEKKIKQIIIMLFFFISLIFILIKNPITERINIQLKIFITESVHLLLNAPKLFLNNQYDGQLNMGPTGYLVHFNSGIQVWKKNKIFGQGLKSFPLNCKFGDNQTCNTHPHNYPIEIMVDTGIVGLILIYLVFIITLKKFLKFYFSISNQNSKLMLLPFLFVIFFEFFPLRSSGSFFTTSNSVIIFLFLSFFINFKKIYFLILNQIGNNK